MTTVEYYHIIVVHGIVQEMRYFHISHLVIASIPIDWIYVFASKNSLEKQTSKGGRVVFFYL